MDFILLGILVVISYFIGNFNFARIISKIKHNDITKSGSGNPGATNMLRTYGFGIGILTLTLDAIKGVIPALTGFLLFGGAGGGIEAQVALYACGDATIIGHIYPVIYKFKGGKGISTTLGVFAVADPLVMLVVFVGAFIYVYFFEYVSVASLLITTILTIIEVCKIPESADPSLALTVRILIFAIFCLTWFAHRANIRRLLVGKENKASLRKAFKKLKKQEKKQEKIEQKQEMTQTEVAQNQNNIEEKDEKQV